MLLNEIARTLNAPQPNTLCHHQPSVMLTFETMFSESINTSMGNISDWLELYTSNATEWSHFKCTLQH